MKKIAVFLLLVFFSIINVKAASICDLKEQAELRNLTDNVKVSSDMVEDTMTIDGEEWPTEYFQITILNLPEKLYVKITNNVNAEEKILTYADNKEGVIYYNWNSMIESTKFKIEIYSSDKTGCPHEVYKTTYVSMPRYNEYSEMQVCKDNADLDLCQKYVTWEKLSEEDFINKLNKEISNKEENAKKEEETPEKVSYKNPVITFLNNYKWFIIGAGILIVLGSTGYVIFKKAKKHKDALNGSRGSNL